METQKTVERVINETELSRIRQADLLEILKFIDRNVWEALQGKKADSAELKKIVIVGIVSLKNDLLMAKKSQTQFRRKVSELSQLDALSRKF